MQIEGKELNIEQHYLDNVTYIPSHAKGNAGHKDSQTGVIINFNDTDVFVMYCNSRTVQGTNPNDLVWG